MDKNYSVLCIDLMGVGSWEDVEYIRTDAEGYLHGFVARTGKLVKLWEDDDYDFIGTTYEGTK